MPAHKVQCLFLSIVLLVLAGCKAPPIPPKSQPETGAWYWHSPVDVTELQWRQARSVGFKALYVRSGTLSYDGLQFNVALPQTWKAAPKIRAWLVINADRGAIRHMEDVQPEQVAELLVRHFEQQRTLASKAGAEVLGLQLDIDVPSRLLPQYAEIATEIRKLRPELPLSCTTLQDWIRQAKFAEFASKFDWVVPQFYEGYLTESPRKVRQSDLSEMPRLTQTLRESGIRFAVGAATFRQTYIYDTAGKLVATDPGRTAASLYVHPSFQWDGTFADGQQQAARFTALRSAKDGRGKGYQFVVTQTGPENFREFRAIITDAPIIVYAWPATDPDKFLFGFQLPPADPCRPARLEVSKTFDPSPIVEGTSKGRTLVNLRLTSSGFNSGLLEPDGLRVMVKWKEGTFLRCLAKESKIRTLSSLGTEVSAPNASALEITRPGLVSGESVNIGLEWEGGSEVELQVRHGALNQCYTDIGPKSIQLGP